MVVVFECFILDISISRPEYFESLSNYLLRCFVFFIRHDLVHEFGIYVLLNSNFIYFIFVHLLNFFYCIWFVLFGHNSLVSKENNIFTSFLLLFSSYRFFILVLTCGFSQKSEWQQVSSGLQYSSKYFRWFWLCWVLDGLGSSSDL